MTKSLYRVENAQKYIADFTYGAFENFKVHKVDFAGTGKE